MSTRPAALILGLLLLAISACVIPGQGQASTSNVATGEPTAPEVSTTSTPLASTNPTSPPSTDDTRFCTEIGCDSVLTIELSEVDITPNATYDIEICVNGDCAREAITIDVPDPGTGEITRGESRLPGTSARWMLMEAEGDYIDYYLPEDDYGESATVTFTLEDASGSVLTQTEGATEVPLERSQPNGPGCPPVCFFGRMSV